MLLLQCGEYYYYTGGAEISQLLFVCKRKDLAYVEQQSGKQITIGCSIGKGFIFQWKDGSYMEMSLPAIIKYIEEIK